MVITGDQIRVWLDPYGISASPRLCASIQRYMTLLLQWNRRISLTTVTDPAEIVRFHFGESLFAVSVVPIRNGRLADVGSGAGFPGLALKLAVPELHATLIESNAKKATFLSEVVRDLTLEDVTIARTRTEDYSSRNKPFDFVTARALGKYADLLSWSKVNLVPRGKVVLWIGEEECAKISNLSGWTWRDPVHIPGSERRFLLTASPNL